MHVSNGHTDFLLRIIELLHFLRVPNCTMNHLANFEIDRTFLKCLKLRTELSVTERQINGRVQLQKTISFKISLKKVVFKKLKIFKSVNWVRLVQLVLFESTVDYRIHSSRQTNLLRKIIYAFLRLDQIKYILEKPPLNFAK